jgi:hypothetical protein
MAQRQRDLGDRFLHIGLRGPDQPIKPYADRFHVDLLHIGRHGSIDFRPVYNVIKPRVQFSRHSANPPRGFIDFVASQSSVEDVIFELDTSWNATNGELVANDSGDIDGNGHWTITQTTAVVPEPSTAIVAVFGAVSGIAHGLVRKRRSQRRQVDARHTLPTE